MKFFRVSVLSAACAVALLGAPVYAQEQPQEGQVDTNPYNYPDDSYISMSGTVRSVSPNSFSLDYEGGQILVEMDDGDRDADAYVLLEGDKVMVSGRIDADMFESHKIEASSVYVEKLNTYFYASAVDEEDRGVVIPHVLVEPVLWLQGKVKEVDGSEFTLGVGETDLTVSVDDMASNPLDDEGYPVIESGDVVSVRITPDSSFMQNDTLAAASVVKIHDSSML